jgi:hypothetical protein
MSAGCPIPPKGTPCPLCGSAFICGKSWRNSAHRPAAKPEPQRVTEKAAG